MCKIKVAVRLMTWNCMLKASWIAVPFNYANRHGTYNVKLLADSLKFGG